MPRYFIERSTWDDTLEVFINSDGNPSQFALSPHFSILCPAHLSNCTLVHTHCSMVRDPFPILLPLPDVYLTVCHRQ
jgi:hypothetical protein